jgi:ParB-like chromosome segregation protein Spo0J
LDTITISIVKEALEAVDEDIESRVAVYNEVVRLAAEMVGLPHPCLSPRLIPGELVEANDYNPNVVAPPELKLLKHSIRRDGVTMAVVVAPNPKKKGATIVVDGFHRTTVVKEEPDIRESLKGYVPVVHLEKGVADLMASTVRHNMARGTHQVELSAKLITLLTKHHWEDDRIGEELGMEKDAVLRMKQVSGLADAFADKEFSEAWEVAEEPETTP